jgi:hypothetical protein
MVPGATLFVDALFVLLALFLIFARSVPRIIGMLSNPNGRSHFSGCPAKTLRKNVLADSGMTSV